MIIITLSHSWFKLNYVFGYRACSYAYKHVILAFVIQEDKS
jgi:hypothetical protein